MHLGISKPIVKFHIKSIPKLKLLEKSDQNKMVPALFQF